jgi:hypothetical protein
VAARKWRSNANANTDAHTQSDADSKTDTDSNSNAHSNTSAQSRMLRNMERKPGLHRRHDGEFERHQLHRRLLDAEPESGDEQWPGRKRAALDSQRPMRRTNSDAHANAQTYTHTNADPNTYSHADANTYSHAYANTYACAW